MNQPANAPAKAIEQPAASSNPAALPPTPTVRPDFSGSRLKLGARPIPGHHICWVNDTGTNVEEYLGYGYQFVTQLEQGRPQVPGRPSVPGEHIRVPVGTQADGTPMYAFLMKITDLLFSEGMATIEARNKAVQDSLKRNFKQAQGLGESRDRGAFYSKESNNFESQVTRPPPDKG